MSKNFIKSFSYKEDKESIISELGVIAARERKDSSKIIVELIEQYVKEHAQGNNTFKLDNWNNNPDFKAVPTILSHSEIWYKYLEDCSAEERLRIQIQANHINKQCVNISSQK